MNHSAIREEHARADFERRLSPEVREQIAGLRTPARIQAFLDGLPYSEDPFYRCPLRVLTDRKAHCFDGALLAAALLRRNGEPAELLELVPNERDDDHLVALFRVDGLWGALAQSNYSGLRYREPVYRSLRELAMSYFEDYFNPAGERTLLGYRGPIRLGSFDHLDWMASDARLEQLSDGMDRYQVHPLIPSALVGRLGKVSARSLAAGLIGSNPDGLYRLPDREPGEDR